MCPRSHMHTHPHTNTHLDTHGHLRAEGLKKGFRKEKDFQERFEGTGRGCVTDRREELVPCCWSLVRVWERALTTRCCPKGWYSEHAGVCRGTELLGRIIRVRKTWEVGGGRTIQRFKAKWSEFEIYPIFSIGSQSMVWRRGVTWLDLEDRKMSRTSLFWTFEACQEGVLGNQKEEHCRSLT